MGSTAREPEPRGERRFHQLSSLQLESVRRRTFASWPSASVDPDALARDGFFYMGEKDHVRCVFCGCHIGAWTPNDHVRTDHARYSPECSFVAGSLTGNIPRTPRTHDDDAGRLYAFLDDYHDSRLAHGRPRTRGRYQSDAVPLPSAEQPALSEFARKDTRRRTFSGWPKGAGAGADPLAEAGFIYTGVGDWVQCFQCSGGIHTWRHGDDPWADHAHFYPYCPFVREHLEQRGGESGVGEDLAPSPPPASSVPSRPEELSPEETELLLHHPIAQRLLSKGFDHRLVKEALKQKVETSGLMCSSLNEALEIIFDYEDSINESLSEKST
ncbi:death-associated inhibitor of apoptosis 1-like [Penaeus chinensis]|uniref:death-associated inhibitor of apoptosis 1-like n=1 Tax=Penaeus chinensis TaxID=139456 RepID=UPI001FB5F7EB|nr:death-associated inhibitor of apoptosis 1-like [Penaeus chinensis]